MSTIDLQADLQDRWVPSRDQVAKANDTLVLFPQLAEVYTLHLLVNKRRHVWTADIVVEHMPHVYFARADALATLMTITEAYHDTTGLSVTGGYTVHEAHSDWSVFEDGVSSYPRGN